MKKILPLLLIFMPLSIFCQIDTEFWFGAPDLTMGTASEIANGNRRDSTVLLVFSTFDQPSQVRVSQPANLDFTPIVVNIPANSTQEVNLGLWLSDIETKPANTVLNTGLLVRATKPINAYYEIRTPTAGNADIYSLKGKNGLGTKFYTPFQQEFRNNQSLNNSPYIPGPRSGFIVMATDDNTTVQITPAVDLFGHPADEMFEVVLNRGQTYACESVSGEPGTKPAGTLIESDKPIVVSVKDDMIDCTPQNDSGADVAGDQLIAEEYLGTEHIFVKSNLVDNSDRIVVCGVVDGTDLFIDGSTTPITIDAGEQHIYAFDGDASYLTSSEKVAVFHIAGFSIQLSGAVVPSLECTGSNQVGFVRAFNRPFFLSITIRAGSEGGFELNGNPNLVPASAFSPVPGTDGEYVWARISYNTSQIPVGQANLLTNFGDELFHMGMTNGNQQQMCNYGYFSAFSFLNIGENSEVCIGDSLTLDAGPGKTSYAWSTGEETQSITVTQPGTYYVEVFSGSDCSATDTITVSYYQPPINLGQNDTICAGTPQLIEVDGNYLFTWSDGSTGNSIEVSEEGWVWVEVTDFQECTLRDSLFVTVSPRPDIPGVTGQDIYCVGETLQLSIDTTENASYRFSRNDSIISFSQTLTIENLQFSDVGVYEAFVVIDGCESFSNLINIEILPSPIFSLPEDQILCQGETFILNTSLNAPNFSYLWQNGSTNQTIFATQTGTYYVDVINDFDCLWSDTTFLQFNPVPDNPALTGNEPTCEGTQLTINTQNQQDVTYTWTDAQGNIIFEGSVLDFEQAMLSQSGAYSVIAQQENCASGTVNFEIQVLPGPVVTLPADTTICDGETLVISAEGEFSSIQWDNGSSESVIIVGSGAYEATVSSDNGCTAIASISIAEDGPTAAFNFSPLGPVEPEQLVEFTDQSASGEVPISQWLWAFGDGGSSTQTNPDYAYPFAGVFPITLTVTDENGCSSITSDEIAVRYELSIPGGFSPNGDGVGDIFIIRGLEGFPGSSIKIFNRWGSPVFESNNYSNNWDGDDLPVGTYFYVLRLSNGEDLAGSITLVR